MINEILKAVDIKRRKHTHVRRRYSFNQNSCSFIFWCSVSVFFIFSPDVLKSWRKLKAQNLLEEQFPSPFTENDIWQEYTYFYISFRGGRGACTLILRVLSHFPDSLPFPVICSRHISSPFLIFDIMNLHLSFKTDAKNDKSWTAYEFLYQTFGTGTNENGPECNKNIIASESLMANYADNEDHWCKISQ